MGDLLSLNYPLIVLPGGDFQIEAPRTSQQARDLADYVAAAERIATLGRDLLREWQASQGDQCRHEFGAVSAGTRDYCIQCGIELSEEGRRP